MNWLDLVFLVIIAASVVTGIRKGLTREVIGLASVLFGIVLGTWFYGVAGSFLLPYVSSRSIANFAGFLIVFAVAMTAGAITGWIVGRFLKMTGLSILDHVLGAGFGAVRGALIVVALVMAVMAFSPDGKAPSALARSRVAPYAADTARFFASVAPHELREGFRKTYGQVTTTWKDALKKGTHPEGKNEREI